MAKSSRSNIKKHNNRLLKAKVFGPVEAARAERLSAKLLEIAAQPRPGAPDAEGSSMKIVNDDEEAEAEGPAAGFKEEQEKKSEDDDQAMDVDSGKPAAAKGAAKPSSKGKIQKRRKPSKIVFPKYKDRKAAPSKRRH